MTRASTIALATTALPRVWAYNNSPRVKPSQAAHTVTEGVFDHAALELAVAQSFGLRHAEVAADLQRLASAQPWDPAPPLRMGPQRCLSSRETIERLAFVLPKEPNPTSEAISRAWSRALLSTLAGAQTPAHWRDIFERDRERVSRALTRSLEYEARLTGRTGRSVWMGGDYIDDGTKDRGRVREVFAAIDSIARTVRTHGPRG